MSARIFRYMVDVDDRIHAHDLRGEIVAVGCRKLDAVEFWSVDDEDEPYDVRRFTVVGTGHPLPEGGIHRGTAVAPGGQLVWHLIEVTS